MRRAYSYIRFSTPEQLKGDSLRRQLQLSKDYADRNGLALDETFHLRDLGISAFRGRNAREGALGAFLDAVHQGRVPKGSVLLVESLDRLSRDTVDEALTLFLGILKAGIDITTLKPLREYTKASVKSPINLMEPLFIMARANEESATKASRLKDAWRGKRQKLRDRKLTARIPAWLTLRADYTGFDPRPKSVKVVLDIFQWAANGVGVNTITKRLNEANVYNFGNRSKTGWHRSYVLKILRNKAVLGEFQPHTLEEESHPQEEGKRRRVRKPVGDAIPDYYPRIVSDTLFYQAQQALSSRRNQRGRRGKGVANLFTGLLFDARDGLPLNLVNKGKKASGVKLVSSGAIRGVPGSVYRSFPYALFETAFLKAMMDLQPSDICESGPTKEDRINLLSGQLSELDEKVEKVKQRVGGERNIDALLDMLERLGSERDTLAAELEKLQAESAMKSEDALGDVQSMADVLAEVEGEERELLREKLKARIRLLVKEIWILVHEEAGKRYADTLIFYRNNKWRSLLIWERPITLKCRPRTADGVQGEEFEASAQIIAHGLPTDDPIPPEEDLRNYRHTSRPGR